MTDIDGIMRDKDDASTLIKVIKVSDAPGLISDGIIQEAVDFFASCERGGDRSAVELYRMAMSNQGGEHSASKEGKGS